MGEGSGEGLLPNSLKIISSCIKTVSTNASTVVRSAGASVAASIAASGDDQRDQVFVFLIDVIYFLLYMLINCLLSIFGCTIRIITLDDINWNTS